jgi:hypothetical protein
LISIKDRLVEFAILIGEVKGGGYADRFDAGFRGRGDDVHHLCRSFDLGRAPVPAVAAGIGRWTPQSPQLLIGGCFSGDV